MTFTIHTSDLPSNLDQYLHEVERLILIRALQRCYLNRTKAGKLLGLSLRQIRYRMESRGLSITDVPPGPGNAYYAEIDVERQGESTGVCGEPVDRTQIVVADTITRW